MHTREEISNLQTQGINILKDYPFPGRNWLQVLQLPTITQSTPHIRFHPHQHSMIASWEWIRDALYLSIASKQPGQTVMVTCCLGWGTAFPGASSAWTAPPPWATQALGSVPRCHGFLCPAASLLCPNANCITHLCSTSWSHHKTHFL